MKRFLCLLLSIILILAAFSSCDDKGKGEETSASSDAGVEDSTVPAYLQNLNYENQTVTIHTRGDQNTIDEIGLESHGDILSEALWKRTTATEERLSVDIEISAHEGWSKYNNAVAELRQSINSGLSQYDIIAGWSCRVAPLIFEGLFYDLNTFGQYDAEADWWSESVTDALTIQGELCLTTGDISTQYMDCCTALLVNETVSTAFGYSYDSFYDIVYSGEWTMEYFYQLVYQTYADDGNSVRDAEDTYGFLIESGYRDVFWTSCGISAIENDGVNLPKWNYDVQKVQSVAEKVYNLLYDNVGCEVTTSTGAVSDPAQMFKADRSMFVYTLFLNMGDYAAEANSRYGVLPMPKFDSQQKDYKTFVHQGMTLFGIPTDAQDAEMSCAVISSMAYDSQEIVIIPHYETLLKTRYVKDSTSGYMIDVIYNGIWMNFDSLYNEALGETITKKDTMPTFIFRFMKEGQFPNINGWWAEQGDGLESRLDALLASLSE